MPDAFDEALAGLGADPASEAQPEPVPDPEVKDAALVGDDRVDAVPLDQLPGALLGGHHDESPYPGCLPDGGNAEPPDWAVEQVPAHAYAEQLQEGAPEMHDFDEDGWHAVVEVAEPLGRGDDDYATPLNSPPVPAPWLTMQATLTARSNVVARLS